MRTVTKVMFLLCLVTVVMVPVLVWAFTDRDLSGIAAFVGATTGPLGVLTGAMAARRISRDRTKKDPAEAEK